MRKPRVVLLYPWEAIKGTADQLLVQLLLEALDHGTTKGQCLLLVFGAEGLCEALLAETHLDEPNTVLLLLKGLLWACHQGRFEGGLATIRRRLPIQTAENPWYD